MHDTPARGRRATRPAAPEPPVRLLVDVVAPVQLASGAWLLPGQTLCAPRDAGEPVTVASALPYAAWLELQAHVGGALALRTAAPEAPASGARAAGRLQVVRADGTHGPARSVGGA